MSLYAYYSIIVTVIVMSRTCITHRAMKMHVELWSDYQNLRDYFTGPGLR
jgi:hypothetical protein